MSELAKLTEAAKQGDLEAVKAVLHGNAEFVKQKDATDATALHYAAFAAHRTVVQELVSRQAGRSNI